MSWLSKAARGVGNFATNLGSELVQGGESCYDAVHTMITGEDPLAPLKDNGTGGVVSTDPNAYASDDDQSPLGPDAPKAVRW